MRALVTGMNGTVAPALGRALEAAGWAVTPWDRTSVSIDDEGAARAFLDSVRPDVFFHVATGPLAWAETVARLCAEADLRFLYTSTVSVFGADQRGPFAPDADPRPDDDYGRYKLDGERRVRAAHPGAVVVRLGWQIGLSEEGNHMGAFLHRTAAEQGAIEASTQWRPACSFLADTADALVETAHLDAGCYHLDGNPDLSFYDLAVGLARLTGAGWTVRPSEDPDRDHRMIDSRLAVRPVTDRLAPADGL